MVGGSKNGRGFEEWQGSREWEWQEGRNCEGSQEWQGVPGMARGYRNGRGSQELREIPGSPGGLRGGRWPQKWQGAPSKGVPRFAGVPGAASGPKNGKGSRKAGKFWIPEKSGGSRFFPVFFLLLTFFLDFSSISRFL